MGYVHGPMFFSVLLSANLLLVQFCLRGPVPDGICYRQRRYSRNRRSYKIGPHGGFAENLPYALWVKRIFRKNLVVSGFRTFRAPETDSIRTGSAKAYKKSRRL